MATTRTPLVTGTYAAGSHTPFLETTVANRALNLVTTGGAARGVVILLTGGLMAVFPTDVSR